MNKKLFQRLGAIALATGSTLSFAAPVTLNFTGLTDAVDIGSTVLAVIAVAGTLAALFVAVRGAKTVLGMIKGR